MFQYHKRKIEKKLFLKISKYKIISEDITTIDDYKNVDDWKCLKLNSIHKPQNDLREKNKIVFLNEIYLGDIIAQFLKK